MGKDSYHHVSFTELLRLDLNSDRKTLDILRDAGKLVLWRLF